MNTHAIYQKSGKGAQAISTRQHGLTPKQRSMLILVDGKRSFEELAKLAAMLGEPAQLLQELEAGGFIELAAAGPAAAHAPAPAAAPQAAVPPTISLPDFKRLAVRRLTDAMGPMAEDLCLRIEGARTAAELQAAVARAEGLLRQARGSAAADAFASGLAAHTPPP